MRYLKLREGRCTQRHRVNEDEAHLVLIRAKATAQAWPGQPLDSIMSLKLAVNCEHKGWRFGKEKDKDNEWIGSSSPANCTGEFSFLF